MQELGTAAAPWALRRRRTEELRGRHSFASELLGLYEALLPVQEAAFSGARAARPPASELVSYVADNVLPKVVDATLAAGPRQLAGAAVQRFHDADLEDVIGRWLRSEQQPALDRYLARASSQPVLEAASDEVLAACAGPRDSRHCPRCGGLPQLAYSALSGEPLVTGPRFLVCSRCLFDWQYPRLVCAACGGDVSQNLVSYSETELLPQLSVEGCQACGHYVVSVDLRREPGAVPLVDELVALPLDLHARESGFSKLMPNLMGI